MWYITMCEKMMYFSLPVKYKRYTVWLARYLKLVALQKFIQHSFKIVHALHKNDQGQMTFVVLAELGKAARILNRLLLLTA